MCCVHKTVISSFNGVYAMEMATCEHGSQRVNLAGRDRRLHLHNLPEEIIENVALHITGYLYLNIGKLRLIQDQLSIFNFLTAFRHFRNFRDLSYILDLESKYQIDAPILWPKLLICFLGGTTALTQILPAP